MDRAITGTQRTARVRNPPPLVASKLESKYSHVYLRGGGDGLETRNEETKNEMGVECGVGGVWVG